MACPKCEVGNAGSNSHCHCICGGSHVRVLQTGVIGLHEHDASAPNDHGARRYSSSAVPGLAGEGWNGGLIGMPIADWISAPAFLDPHRLVGCRQVRFLAVFHQWHVSSRGFETVELQATDRESALDEASRLLRARQGFYSVDFTLVELERRERLPRRLSWLERLTGRLRRD